MDAADIKRRLAVAGDPPGGIAAPDAFWERAHAAHLDPPRHYHTFDHVCAVAGHYAEVAAAVGWDRPREAFAAVLFHDAVYRVGRADNERASAALARAELARWQAGGDGDIDADRVAALIELTAGHGRHTPGDVDAEAALLLDCDMAILGADPAAFAAYDDAVAREWAQVVPPAAYAAGRRQFLARTLVAERIFLSPYFHDRLDARARANLQAAIDRIDAA